MVYLLQVIDDVQEAVALDSAGKWHRFQSVIVM